MKVGQKLMDAQRETFKNAALKSNEDGTYESRVDEAAIRKAVIATLTKSPLSLGTFSSGSVGVRVPIAFDVTNDEGEEFTLRGQFLVTIPETVVKAAK